MIQVGWSGAIIYVITAGGIYLEMILKIKRTVLFITVRFTAESLYVLTSLRGSFYYWKNKAGHTNSVVLIQCMVHTVMHAVHPGQGNIKALLVKRSCTDEFTRLLSCFLNLHQHWSKRLRKKRTNIPFKNLSNKCNRDVLAPVGSWLFSTALCSHIPTGWLGNLFAKLM